MHKCSQPAVEIDVNIQLAPTGLNPFDDPIDRILAEIALSVQLPPSLHDKAKSRYEAVRRHLETTTAFFDQIEHFYPQGSMAIDATISTRGTDDEYDLDIVSQLGGRFRGMNPLEILTELEAALADYPVQRVVRQTRCVTLFYADKMHLDVTPSLRVFSTLDRESLITHATLIAQAAAKRIDPTRSLDQDVAQARIGLGVPRRQVSKPGGDV